MKYTMKSSAKEIRKGDWLVPYKGFFSQEFIDSAESDMPLETLCKDDISKYHTESIVKALNVLRERYESDSNLFLPLWEGISDIEKEEVQDIVLIPFLIEKESPCYIVCAGGGYCCNVLPNEGIATAMELNKFGKNAVVLTYRVAPYQYPKPQQDLVRAIQYVRANKERFHVKDNKVIIMGYSAAGHLCGSVGALYDQIDMPMNEDSSYETISKRPDAIILNYPVVSFVNDPHVGSANNLLGEDADQEKRKAMSVEYLIDNNYPPTFVWHCDADDVVLPSNSVLLNKVLDEYKIPHEFHLFPGGGHGCGLAAGTEASSWLARAIDFVEKY